MCLKAILFWNFAYNPEMKKRKFIDKYYSLTHYFYRKCHKQGWPTKFKNTNQQGWYDPRHISKGSGRGLAVKEGELAYIRESYIISNELKHHWTPHKKNHASIGQTLVFLYNILFEFYLYICLHINWNDLPKISLTYLFKGYAKFYFSSFI